MRASAVSGIGDLGPSAKQAVPVLRSLLESEHESLRVSAAVALGRMGASANVAIPDLVELLRGGRRSEVSASGRSLVALGAPSVPPLMELLKSDNKQRRRLVKDLLRQIPDAIPALADAMRDGDTQLRIDAGDALRKMGAKSVAPLIELLEHKSADVRRNAAWRLGEMKRKALGAVPALIKLLEDKDSHVVAQAAWSLGEIGPGAKDAIPRLEALHKQGRSRQIIAEALKKIRD